MTTPPNPRDLTDDEIIGIAKETASADPGRDGYVLPVTFARAIEAKIRAADREARPAPAIVEALAKWHETEAGRVRYAASADWHDKQAKLIRALAASTPPAEAEPDSNLPASVWLNDTGTGQKLTFAPLAGAFEHHEYRRATPPASEARATGDAALRSAAQDALDTFQTICNYCDSSDIGPTIAEEIESACDGLRAALSQRAATGAAGEPQPREGWKWVPVEPTKEMVRAGDRFNWPGPSAEVYRAMLAAVPQADSGAAGGQGDSNA